MAFKLPHQALGTPQQHLIGGREEGGIQRMRSHLHITHSCSIAYCGITNHSKIQWLKTATIQLSQDSVGQQFGLGSAEWFFCWSLLGSVRQLQSSGQLARDGLAPLSGG